MGVCGTSKLEIASDEWQGSGPSKRHIVDNALSRTAGTASTVSSSGSPSMSGSTRHLHHVELPVDDLGASLKFFTDALGYQTILISRGEVVLAKGNSMLSLSEDLNANVRRKVRRRIAHLALDVSGKDDLDALYHKVRTYPGATIRSKPQLLMAGPSRRFTFTEPCGNKLEIVDWGM
uniref:VOC domain-containing protein n=1 Tax=Lotharella globosa TaxID=91324 RepID=A0A7S3ZB37_9EUKA